MKENGSDMTGLCGEWYFQHLLELISLSLLKKEKLNPYFEPQIKDWTKSKDIKVFNTKFF